jgi:hypothetical protein
MSDLVLAEGKFVKITYGVLAAVSFAVAGFAGWMTMMEARTRSNVQAIEEIKTNYDAQLDLLHSIDKRLYTIEIILKEKKNE